MALGLFVYGTLKSGERQAGLLRGLPRREGRIRGRLYHLPAGYPALTLDGTDDIFGELVAPPDERLLALVDHYEGIDSGLYRRVVVPVRIGLRTERAWVYEMPTAPTAGGRYLPDGRWRSLRAR